MVAASIRAYLDGSPVEVTRAALALGYIGFYLIEVQLPAITNAGVSELRIGGRGLYAMGERSLFHTLRNAPRVMGRAPAKRKTTSPTMRSHSSLW